jgi:hypothetical protein
MARNTAHTDDPEPIDPKEASRWITAQIRAKKETEKHRARPTDPMPLDPAEASRLIAERIRARGSTAKRPVELISDEVRLARPIPRERLLKLIRADAQQLLEGDRTETGALEAVPISLAEFEWLARGGRRATRRLEKPGPIDREAQTKLQRKPDR